MKKLALITILLCIKVSIIWANKYIRYNQSGYDVNGMKKILVVSNENCDGLYWSIKDVNNNIVLSGQLPNYKVGEGVFLDKCYKHILDLSSLKKEGVYVLKITGIAPVKILIKNRNYRKKDFYNNPLT